MGNKNHDLKTGEFSSGGSGSFAGGRGQFAGTSKSQFAGIKQVKSPGRLSAGEQMRELRQNPQKLIAAHLAQQAPTTHVHHNPGEPLSASNVTARIQDARDAFNAKRPPAAIDNPMRDNIHRSAARRAAAAGRNRNGG